MTVRPFLRWPHPGLRAVAHPVDTITDEVRTLWADMVETMEAMPGVGLAAPQIGVPLRLAVVDASDTRGQAILMANPVLTEVSGDTLRGREASPNLPGIDAEIVRPARVTVQFLGPDGPDRRSLDGLWARSLQHQIDHLDGHVYVDRLSRTRREMLLRRLRKISA